MSTETSLTILVVILSVTLAIFLVLGIVALVKVIQVLGHLKRISEKAEELADKAEEIGAYFQKAAKPAAFMGVVGNIVDSFKQGKRKAKGDRYEEDD